MTQSALMNQLVATALKPFNGANKSLGKFGPWLTYHINLYNRAALRTINLLFPNAIESIREGLGENLFFATLKNCPGLWPDSLDSRDRSSYQVFEVIEQAFRDEGPQLQERAFNALTKAMTSVIDSVEERASLSPLGKSFLTLGESLDLSRTELNLLKFLRTIRLNHRLGNFLDDSCNVFSFNNRSILMKLLEVDRSELVKALSGRLVKLGLIEYSMNSSPRLLNFYHRMMDNSGLLDLNDIVTPALPPTLNINDFFIDTSTISMLQRFLQYPSRTPNHILFYGPPGVGKTELARLLAADLKKGALEVIPLHRENMMMAHSYLRANPGQLLIIDEADSLLESKSEGIFSSYFNSDCLQEKAWLDYFLEKSGPSCLWIVNNTRVINDSVIRRFAFSLKFEKLGRNARLKIWERQKGRDGQSLLSSASKKALANDLDVSPAIIAQAYEKTLEIGPNSEEKRYLMIKKQLTAHLELTGRRPPLTKSLSRFRLGALATNPPIDEITRDLKKWAIKAKNSPNEERRGYKALFYGPPGTGKTELANYLAQELVEQFDFERAHVKVSNLISHYVGQSEINVAKLFRRFDKSLGVIIIDEIESFLYNRDIARRVWELSLVNEFLTCLDRFKGVLIGTTNRPNDLDPAARRRLGRGVEFGPLNQSGRLELFGSFLTPISGQPLTPGETKRLGLMPLLVPGDYARVAEIKAYSSEVDNLSLLAALENVVNKRLELGQNNSSKADSHERKNSGLN
jgi:SpoVK/Ycf46/Vps4 family AAA+-type ATPase